MALIAKNSEKIVKSESNGDAGNKEKISEDEGRKRDKKSEKKGGTVIVTPRKK